MTRKDVMQILNDNSFSREALNDVMIAGMEVGLRALLFIEDGDLPALRKMFFQWLFSNGEVLRPLIERYAEELPDDDDMKNAAGAAS